MGQVRKFRRYSRLRRRRRRRIDVDSQGKRIDVDYVCPKDQTEYTPKSSSRPNRIYHSASFDRISVYIPAATLINYPPSPIMHRSMLFKPTGTLSCRIEILLQTVIELLRLGRFFVSFKRYKFSFLNRDFRKIYDLLLSTSLIDRCILRILI